MQLIDPFPGTYDASDPFGSLGYGRSNGHTGSDWIVASGTPIPAIGSGIVVAKGWHDGNGNYVAVRLEDGHVYAYLHMDRPAPVAVGEAVTIGQIIGYAGNTGSNSQGSHLHVTISDAITAYIGLGKKSDPWAFIQARTTATASANASPITIRSNKMDYFYAKGDTQNQVYLVSIPDGNRRYEHIPALLEAWQKAGGKLVVLPQGQFDSIPKKPGSLDWDHKIIGGK